MLTTAKTLVEHLYSNLLGEGFAFHNINHTLNVVKIVERNAMLCDVSGRLLELTLLAAWFHDTGYLQGYDGHEEISVKLFKSYVPELLLSKEEVEFVEGLILATKVPQIPTNFHQQILCDADLDYLGRPDFERISDHLFQEWMHFNIVQTRYEFDLKQLEFFENHTYHLPQIRDLRNEGKKANEDQIRKRISHHSV